MPFNLTWILEITRTLTESVLRPFGSTGDWVCVLDESREPGRRDDGRDTGTGVPVSAAIIRFLLTLGWGWDLLQSLEQKKNMI